jgi:hypothetical protein
MRDLHLYKELCKIDMHNHNVASKYPYTLQEDLTFTQHELMLHYKQNYCTDIIILTEPNHPKGGAEPNLMYSFVVYEDT